MAGPSECPHCGSEEIEWNGVYGVHETWLCLDCGEQWSPNDEDEIS